MQLNLNTSGLVLKRPVNVKVIVTPAWQEEAQKQLQNQVNQIDSQLAQLEQQGQRAIAEIQKQGSIQATQQIENINQQVNQKKNELLQNKNQMLQQMQQVQLLELGQEVVQAQMESFFEVKEGDNLVEKLNVEVVLRDGVIEEIRGKV
ncbi:YlqD family protein [Cyanobacterium stanieri LEGE 03274]|uniref:YlqD family protein n=1 Tax=Cyanobacterium stanieri LEGE 03274 TaxID=1828756 RepID=A0ABR9V559_9CHRO|nr:YlqD family protein [Cyanobacterium stanieri]MBE9223025.1 YlqD family protein [Cyanobacterium stanieri LEGE 03274]